MGEEYIINNKITVESYDTPNNNTIEGDYEIVCFEKMMIEDYQTLNRDIDNEHIILSLSRHFIDEKDRTALNTYEKKDEYMRGCSCIYFMNLSNQRLINLCSRIKRLTIDYRYKKPKNYEDNEELIILKFIKYCTGLQKLTIKNFSTLRFLYTLTPTCKELRILNYNYVPVDVTYNNIESVTCENISPDFKLLNLKNIFPNAKLKFIVNNNSVKLSHILAILNSSQN